MTDGGEPEVTKEPQTASAGPPPESEEAPALQPRRVGLIFPGALLILFGAWLLVQRSTAINLGSGFPLLPLGVAFLIAGFVFRNDGLLIPGGILTGLGAGFLLEDLVRPDYSEAAFFLAFGGGFLLISILTSILTRGFPTWPLFPAAAMGFVALLFARGSLMERIPDQAAEFALPVGMILLGVLVIVRSRRSPGRSLWLLAVLALVVVGVSLAARPGAALSTDFSILSSRTTTTEEFEIPNLDERVLVVMPSSADLRLSTGPLAGVARITTRGGDHEGAGFVNVREAENEVFVRPQLIPGAERCVLPAAKLICYQSGPRVGLLTISIPEASRIRVESNSGNVRAHLGRVETMAIEGGSSDVNVSGTFGTLVVDTGSGDIAIASEGVMRGDWFIEAGSGKIELGIKGDPSVEVSTGSGDISTSGYAESRANQTNEFTYRGSRGVIRVRSGSGDVRVVRLD